jgi:N-methylhydantoinase A
VSYRISVDTGGTFTDVVVADASGRQVTGKALTTHDKIFEGMRAAIAVAAESIGVEFHELLADAELLIYGTTRATNAIVEGKTAKTAFLTTEGFPDILILKEGGKIGVHDFSKDFPSPYIPRHRTFEIPGRINAEGGIEKELDEEAVRRTLQSLADKKYEAIAVCLLWSVTNPDHELRVGDLIKEVMPDASYTLSHQLLPIIREYRRASATAIDASLKPLMQKHLHEMEKDLRADGFRGELLVSTSYGGCMQISGAAEAPIHTVKSGPAMAPVAARTYGNVEQLGGDIIVCDTGGTTFDVGLVRDGEIVSSRETWLGGQFVGHIIATSTVDIRSCGAGGGSIAWIDPGGLLQVGPHSAGSQPGPACYGRGGTQPTVTDAATALGYFDPENFLGGRMSLDLHAARAAIETVADPLGMTVEDAAWAILKIADELMVKAVQEITVAEGFNPEESAIVAGGGAAGLNILPISRELNVHRVVLPGMAGVLSAAGMQFADIIAEESGSLVTTTGNFDYDGVNDLLSNLEEQLQAFAETLKGRGLKNARLIPSVEARYQGQVWELTIPLKRKRFDGPTAVKEMIESFHQVHDRIYAVTDPGSELECLNWKMRLVVDLGCDAPKSVETETFNANQASRTRTCYFGELGALKTSIFLSEDLSPGALVRGPAVIEDTMTTLVVYPGMAACQSSEGNFILLIEQED